MKKLFIALAISSALFSCKKETTNTTSTTNSSNGVTCIDNPNINFTSIGTPVGKFSDCIKDVDGNVYKTVTIGTQTWMAENLKTLKYNDGTSIPNVKDKLKWSKSTTGAWCYYNNDSTFNKNYGKLYNWYVISPITNGNKNVCPYGWHVPTDGEWMFLFDYLGGEEVAGGKMKETGYLSWDKTEYNASNLSLFSATASGFITNLGVFEDNIDNASFWSQTLFNIDEAKGVGLNDKYLSIEKANVNKGFGMSIRCLKD
jgi:uncharacterized protein (TIGR02145 family)